MRLRSLKFLGSSFESDSDNSSLSDFSKDDVSQRLSTSPNETTVASSDSEERLLWRLPFRPNLNDLLRSQSRLILRGEPLLLDESVHRVSSELTLFVRLKRLGICDRSLAGRGDDADVGNGGSGRLTLVAEVVRLESMLKNIRDQRKNVIECCCRM